MKKKGRGTRYGKQPEGRMRLNLGKIFAKCLLGDLHGSPCFFVVLTVEPSQRVFSTCSKKPFISRKEGPSGLSLFISHVQWHMRRPTFRHLRMSQNALWM